MSLQYKFHHIVHSRKCNRQYEILTVTIIETEIIPATNSAVIDRHKTKIKSW